MIAQLRHFPIQRLSALSLSLLFYICPGSHTAVAQPQTKNSAGFHQQQRNHYLAAKTALDKGQLKTYRENYEQLLDYPLKPYLQYAELKRRLHLLPYKEVDRFLYRNENSYLERRLLKNWLKTLAGRKHWHDYQSYYRTGLDSTELECLYLQGRITTGEENAFKEVEPLWNVGYSQPDACTPLFKTWMQAGHLTPQLAWQRYTKAMRKRELGLARYIASLMPPKQRAMAQLYREVDRHPQRLKNRRRFHEQSPAMQEIILHGIRRYARKDPLEALKQWRVYDAQQLFEDGERSATRQALITQLAMQGEMETAEKLLAESRHNNTSADLIGWIIRDSLRRQEWDKVYTWLQRLPADSQQSDRWRYWRARAMEQLDIGNSPYPTPQQIYADLALKRSFYGFLAADILGRDYTLVDNPVDPPPELIDTVAGLPGIKRARELFELNDIANARHEWMFVTAGLDAPALLAAGKLAEQWRWHRSSIQAMIEAGHWDDLKLRFPLAYKEQVNAAAKSTNITPTLLFAIARRESAFRADARSPAGALGLMQLMPGTAKQTARRAGLQYRHYDLLKPASNISLGSRYLNQLLDQFNGNRILATAAYNAGPHRVKRWLADSDQQQPFDVWIEVIPFKETRSYVQNVLAYSVIYGYRMGSSVPLITPDEAKKPL